MSALSLGDCRRRGHIPLALAALVVLAGMATPLVATIWTRSTNLIALPRGGSTVALKNAAYSTRDWALSVATVGMRERTSPKPDAILTAWSFDYTNTDSQAHYVSITLQGLDGQRRDRIRFTSVFKLDPSQKEPGTFSLAAECTKADWQGVAWVRITIDFLSGPDG